MKTMYTTEQYTNAANYIEDKLAVGEKADKWNATVEQLRAMAAKPNRIASRRVLSPVIGLYPVAGTWTRA